MLSERAGLHLAASLERTLRAASHHLRLRGHRDLPAVLHLVQDHLCGRMTTRASLCAASGLTYGTANRLVESLLADGLVLQRPRTTSGKSVSLHPSCALLDRWRDFYSACSEHAEPGLPARRSCSVARSLPPPAALPQRLQIHGPLRILMHADPTFMAMAALKRQLEMILGVPITSRALSIDRLLGAIVENSHLPVSSYDIVACDFPWFGEMAARGRLLALDKLLPSDPIGTEDFYPDALATCRANGRQYGVPALATAEMLVYRTDLLSHAGLQPPRTTTATVDAARRLHRPEVAGIAWNGARGTPVGHTFVMLLGAFGRSVFDLHPTTSGYDAEHVSPENLRPMFQSAEAAATVDYMRELLPYSPPDVLRMAWFDRANAYASGRAAMAYSHSMLAPLHELNTHSVAYGRSAYLPHPAGPRGRPLVPMGGYGLCIPANIAPERVAPAWTALRMLTSASASKLYLLHGSLSSARSSVSRDPEVDALSPLVRTIDDVARRGLLRMWPRPPVPGMTEVIAIAGEEIHDALTGEKSVSAALAAAQRRATAVMEKGASV